jgi:hypothetical protein
VGGAESVAAESEGPVLRLHALIRGANRFSAAGHGPDDGEPAGPKAGETAINSGGRAAGVRCVSRSHCGGDTEDGGRGSRAGLLAAVRQLWLRGIPGCQVRPVPLRPSGKGKMSPGQADAPPRQRGKAQSDHRRSKRPHLQVYRRLHALHVGWHHRPCDCL